MGDQHGRAGEVGEVLAQEGADVDPGAGVERGHRLVEQEHVGVAGQRSRQGDPLRLPAGELRGTSPRELAQPEPAQPVLGRAP